MNATTLTPTRADAELHAGDLRLALRPDLGGCIAGLWRSGEPVLRSTEPTALQDVRDAAAHPLLPYAHWLGHRRFQWHGRQHLTAENVPGSPHSLHGVGWLRRWQLESCGLGEAVLTYRHAPDAHWPFAFLATQRVLLGADALRVELTLRNEADEAQPFGLGWQAHFPKRQRSRLHAEIAERWEADATGLPTRRVAQPGIDADVAHLDFDHGFEGWHGAARIRDERFSLGLASSLDRIAVQTPAHGTSFALAPVSHVSNALHMAEPARHGLRSVEPGAETTAWVELQVRGLV